MKPKDTLSRRLADAESMGSEYATSVRKYKESITMKMRTHVVIGVKHSEFPYRVSLNETSRDGGSRELSAIGAFATLFHARKFAKEIAKTYEVDVEEWID